MEKKNMMKWDSRWFIGALIIVLALGSIVYVVEQNFVPQYCPSNIEGDANLNVPLCDYSGAYCVLQCGYDRYEHIPPEGDDVLLPCKHGTITVVHPRRSGNESCQAVCGKQKFERWECEGVISPYVEFYWEGLKLWLDGEEESSDNNITEVSNGSE